MDIKLLGTDLKVSDKAYKEMIKAIAEKLKSFELFYEDRNNILDSYMNGNMSDFWKRIGLRWVYSKKFLKIDGVTNNLNTEIFPIIAPFVHKDCSVSLEQPINDAVYQICYEFNKEGGFVYPKVKGSLDPEKKKQAVKNKSVNEIKDLPKVGVYFGKFIPPHRGHLTAIINAATRCQKLYVVVSDNKERTKRICEESGIKNIPVQLRIQWLSQELQDLNHIKVVALDETHIPEYPNGWTEWAVLIKEAVNEDINVFFCGEEEYCPKLKEHFPKADIILFDPERNTYNISATTIRENPQKHWDHILGPARPFFAKKVLIAGSESCGKTTMVKYLAKLYNTSWSEEVGRYYAEKFLGGNETIFTDEDFGRIAHQQIEQDYAALRSTNKVCFFDTDATVTQYYSILYMGHKNNEVEACVNPDKYDIVILLKPDVEWVDDGQRLNGDQAKREELHNRLKYMYIERGFKNIVEVGGNYNDRLLQITTLVDNLLK